jgi:nitrite reductase/ring-hydroxylating ferredoxin subunit
MQSILKKVACCSKQFVKKISAELKNVHGNLQKIVCTFLRHSFDISQAKKVCADPKQTYNSLLVYRVKSTRGKIRKKYPIIFLNI